MAIDSCSSCSSDNLTTQYIEQLAERTRVSRRAEEAANRHNGNADSLAQPGGPTVNGQGETVGLLINTKA